MCVFMYFICPQKKDPTVENVKNYEDLLIQMRSRARHRLLFLQVSRILYPLTTRGHEDSRDDLDTARSLGLRFYQ